MLKNLDIYAIAVAYARENSWVIAPPVGILRERWRQYNAYI
jgi:hypothetical protein